MIAKFFAAIITGVSEEILNDLLRDLVLEIVINRKSETLSKAVNQYRRAIHEIIVGELNDEEANEKLTAIGRVMLDRVRAAKNA